MHINIILEILFVFQVPGFPRLAVNKIV